MQSYHIFYLSSIISIILIISGFILLLTDNKLPGAILAFTGISIIIISLLLVLYLIILVKNKNKNNIEIKESSIIMA
jgi:membrane-bound ClpP family serine protease